MPPTNSIARAEGAAAHLLELRELACARRDRILFEGVNLRLNAGEILQVDGANGSGKTSLLRILSNLARPSEGVVLWRGADIRANRSAYLAELAYIGHNNGVKNELTPLENLRIARSLASAPSAATPEQTLDRLGLYGFEQVPAHMLSAGQRRRVALARLLLAHAGVWILDEPFTALDKSGVKVVETMLDEHSRAGGIIVFATHRPILLGNRAAKALHLQT